MPALILCRLINLHTIQKSTKNSPSSNLSYSLLLTTIHFPLNFPPIFAKNYISFYSSILNKKVKTPQNLPQLIHPTPIFSAIFTSISSTSHSDKEFSEIIPTIPHYFSLTSLPLLPYLKSLSEIPSLIFTVSNPQNPLLTLTPYIFSTNSFTLLNNKKETVIMTVSKIKYYSLIHSLIYLLIIYLLTNLPLTNHQTNLPSIHLTGVQSSILNHFYQIPLIFPKFFQNNLILLF